MAQEAQEEQTVLRKRLAAAEEAAAAWRMRSSQAQSLADEKTCELRKKEAMVRDVIGAGCLSGSIMWLRFIFDDFFLEKIILAPCPICALMSA